MSDLRIHYSSHAAFQMLEDADSLIKARDSLFNHLKDMRLRLIERGYPKQAETLIEFLNKIPMGTVNFSRVELIEIYKAAVDKLVTSDGWPR